MASSHPGKGGGNESHEHYHDEACDLNFHFIFSYKGSMGKGFSSPEKRFFYPPNEIKRIS